LLQHCKGHPACCKTARARRLRRFRGRRLIPRTVAGPLASEARAIRTAIDALAGTL